MKSLMTSVRMFLFMTLFLGLIYPMIITGIGKVLFRDQASGQLIEKNGRIVGSRLIGQKFENERYFWSRPSAVDYNPLPSGGTNFGPTSSDLQKASVSRIAKLKSANNQTAAVPQDLVFASASGLDPEISPSAAAYQTARIARVRSLSEAQIQVLIRQQTFERQLGIFGEPRVNVLALNLALDELTSSKVR